MQIAIDLWNMMLVFYEKYPKYNKLDLYIFGESYGNNKYVYISYFIYNNYTLAGHYVPAFGKAILSSNSIYAANLKGIGL